jgi:hypothetical protein
VLGYAFSQGALPANQTLRDPNLNINSAFVAYARGLDISGKSAKIDVIVPTICLDGYATMDSQRVTRDVCGVGDIKARLSYNFFGAPASELKDFANFKQDVILGTSVQVTMPTGQYAEEKLVNIGANRWAAKLGVGVSKKLNNFLFELAVDTEFYTKDSQYILGAREQDFIYSGQVHVIYNFSKAIWIALDSNYYGGGESYLNGVGQEDTLDNFRTGLTFAFPLSRSYSLKLYGSSGVITRAGTNFDTLGVALQYKFSDGY